MRRLSGTRAIFLLILVALVVGTIYFGLTYYQENGREGTLEDKLASTAKDIATMAPYHDIGARQAELVRLRIQRAEAHFPRDVEYNAIHDYVMTAKEEAGVTFKSWDVEDPIEETVNGTEQEYRLFSYGATISGTLDEIFDFLAEMEANAPYETIKLIDVELIYDSYSDSWEMTFEIWVFAQPD